MSHDQSSKKTGMGGLFSGMSLKKKAQPLNASTPQPPNASTSQPHITSTLSVDGSELSCKGESFEVAVSEASHMAAEESGIRGRNPIEVDMDFPRKEKHSASPRQRIPVPRSPGSPIIHRASSNPPEPEPTEIEPVKPSKPKGFGFIKRMKEKTKATEEVLKPGNDSEPSCSVSERNIPNDTPAPVSPADPLTPSEPLNTSTPQPLNLSTTQPTNLSTPQPIVHVRESEALRESRVVAEELSASLEGLSTRITKRAEAREWATRLSSPLRQVLTSQNDSDLSLARVSLETQLINLREARTLISERRTLAHQRLSTQITAELEKAELLRSEARSAQADHEAKVAATIEALVAAETAATANTRERKASVDRRLTAVEEAQQLVDAAEEALAEAKRGLVAAKATADSCKDELKRVEEERRAEVEARRLEAEATAAEATALGDVCAAVEDVRDRLVTAGVILTSELALADAATNALSCLESAGARLIKSATASSDLQRRLSPFESTESSLTSSAEELRARVEFLSSELRDKSSEIADLETRYEAAEAAKITAVRDKNFAAAAARSSETKKLREKIDRCVEETKLFEESLSETEKELPKAIARLAEFQKGFSREKAEYFRHRKELLETLLEIFDLGGADELMGVTKEATRSQLDKLSNEIKFFEASFPGLMTQGPQSMDPQEAKSLLTALKKQREGLQLKQDKEVEEERFEDAEKSQKEIDDIDKEISSLLQTFPNAEDVEVAGETQNHRNTPGYIQETKEESTAIKNEEINPISTDFQGQIHEENAKEEIADYL